MLTTFLYIPPPPLRSLAIPAAPSHSESDRSKRATTFIFRPFRRGRGTMKPVLNVIRLSRWPIYRQLVLEEFLLRHQDKNFLVLNDNMVGKAIVMGFSAKPEDLIYTDTAKRDGIQVIRRFTGGGTVIVDHHTVFASFIMNSTDVPSQPYPREIMQWTEGVYKPVFDELIRSKTPDEFRLRENDYVIGEKKIGGNAQSIVKGRWIHHTSFLFDFDARNMEYLKMPAKRPAYRSDRPHTSFLTPIAPLLANPQPSSLYTPLLRRLEAGFDVHGGSALEERAGEDWEQRMKTWGQAGEKEAFKTRTVIEQL